MKTCPKCAEEVQDAAKVCKHCGYSFEWKPPRIGCLGTIVIGVLALWAAAEWNSTETAEAPPRLLDTYSAERVAQCSSLIDDAQREGLIRARPSKDRINVDERLWAAFPASSKRGLMLGLACEAYRRQLASSEFVSAYGYRSGKRLALATTAGIDLD